MNKDDLLLSEAYAQVYNEGIWDRLKGQASGIGSGLRQGVQNVAGKIAGATGANVQTSGKTMGGAYANAQQTSLLNSFIKKAQGELNDFVNDMSKMGAGSIQDVQKTHPQIAQQMQQVNDVIEYLKQTAAGQKPDANAQAPAAPAAAPQAQDGSTNAASAATTGDNTDANAAGDQSQNVNFNADVAGKPPAIQAQGGTVQNIPHGPQRTSTPGGTTNTSFSMADSVPTGAKQLNQLQPEEPVQSAVPTAGVQDAEIGGDEESQKTGGTPEIARNEMEQQFGPSKEAYQSNTPEGQSVQASQSDLNNGSGAVEKKPYNKKADGWYIGATKVGDSKAKILDDLWKKQNKGTQQSSPEQSGGLKTAAQIGAQGGNKTKVNEAFRFWRRF